jgi:hypothetical protein
MDIDLKSSHFTDPLGIKPLTVLPLTVTPIAVHLKELNQIAPLSVDSLRVDHVRHIDPLKIEQLDITSLPTVNLTMSQLPALDINVRRVPPVAVALQQQFEMCSDYSMTARVFSLPLMRLSLTGRTTITPKDCVRREQSTSHERSFPDVAALGNPGIPARVVETCVQTVSRPAAAPKPRRPGVNPGAPRFGFSLQQVESRAPAAGNAVNGG